MATLLPLPDAALHLGLSQSALRRRLRAGTVCGERRPTPSGFSWWVEVDGSPTPTAARQPDAPDAAAPSPPPTAPRQADTPQEGPGGALLATRAQEMAQYTAELLAPLHARLEAQAERIGHLEERAEHLQTERDTARAELEQSRARIAELEAPPAPEPQQNPPFPEERPRRWWQRLLWG